MKILFWQIFLIVLAFLIVFFIIKWIKKIKNNNTVKVFIFFLTIISYSCSNENLELKQERLKQRNE